MAQSGRKRGRGRRGAISSSRAGGRLTVAQLIETDGPGGAEQMVARLARALRAKGARVIVYVPARGEGWLAAQLEGTDIVVEEFTLAHAFSPRFARALARSFLRHGVDVAHSHEFAMGVYGAWAARLSGAAHINTMHGSRYYAERWLRRLALRWAVGNGERLVSVSAPLREALARDLWLREERIVLVPNGVPTPVLPKRSTLPAELGLTPGDTLLVSVGNLYPVKGHRFAVDALRRLVAQYPTLHYAIAGRGALSDSLRQQAEELGVADRLHLLGLRSDLGNVLAAAKVFVLPSISEGLPLALLEAMLSGRTIVASDVGDVGDALDHGNAGLVVPAGDGTALAAAIKRLLDDPDFAGRLARQARQRALERYEFGAMLSRYEALYAEAVASMRGSGPPAAG